MKELTVVNSKIGYGIYLDSSFESFSNILTEKSNGNIRKVFVVVDNRVANVHGETIDYFQQELNAKIFIFTEGETNKSLDTLCGLYDFLIENEADRSSTLIAFGGGVTGDLTGFAAATFMRGIKFINIPTTLVAQVDSSIGGKTGYNYRKIKNIIGTFYNPEMVYISTHFLQTLNKEQLLDGMGEIIKYALIKDASLFKFIEENCNKILGLDKDVILHVVKGCLCIKAEVIAKDYKDVGLRNILNFGHTIGHGIEVDSNYSIPHGIAVALGMLSAIKLSEKKLMLSSNIYKRVEGLYMKLGIPIRYKVDNVPSFLYAIRRDKKNIDNINFVLMEDIGVCKIKVPVSENEIILAVENSIDREVKVLNGL